MIALSALLASCAEAGPEPPNPGEHHAVIAATLAAQPDIPQEMREFLEDRPEERSLWPSVFDQRLCVAPFTAGSEDEMELARPEYFGAPEAAFAWKESRRRFRIPDTSIPDFLRKDRPFSICPHGVIHLSNPVIEGGTARVVFETECSGWCGWGGQVVLEKRNGQWSVERTEVWWQA